MSKKAEWAARLICEGSYDIEVEYVSADKVVVTQWEGDQPVAGTTTTETALLRAMIRQVMKLHEQTQTPA